MLDRCRNHACLTLFLLRVEALLFLLLAKHRFRRENGLHQSHKRSDQMSPKTVVFDLDGTLVDTAPDLTAALNFALEHLGAGPVTKESVRHLAGDGSRALLRFGLGSSASDALIERGLPLFFDHYTRNSWVHSAVFEGVEQTLHDLTLGGFSLAICTNKPVGLATELLAKIGWEGLFAAVIGGDSLTKRKPDPAPLRECLRRTCATRGVFVGDSIIDAQAARAAGLAFIAVSFGYSDRSVATFGADCIVDHFSTIPAAIDSLIA